MYFPFVSSYLSQPLQLLFVVLVVVTIVLNAAGWWLAIYFFPVSDPAAVLHYSIDVGIDFIGEGKQIASLPLLGSLLFIFNTVLGVALLRADQRAAWILWSVMPLIQLILLVAFYLLWRINI